jgi:hypothetical protein
VAQHGTAKFQSLINNNNSTWIIRHLQKEKATKNHVDEVQASAGPLIVKGYRRIAAANNIAPTAKTSDQKIIEIYQGVGSAFREVSQQRNEYIPAGHLNSVVLKFFKFTRLWATLCYMNI